MPIEKIIVLEDDLIVRKNLEHQLRQRRYDVAGAATLAEAQEFLNKDNFDLMFVDVRLPDGDGTELLKGLQTRPLKPLVIITTGFGSIESAVECMRNGAFDYLIKPFSNDQIEITLRKAESFTQILKVNQYFSHDDTETKDELLGVSGTMEHLRQLIRKIARTQATVLIQGESGTGKELVARALYRESPRSQAPFIKLNCAAIPENLIESEFFGHERGAFTGALTKREGRFELAHGGTLLLDEISEISPAVQAKLLRVLQEREFERVGGNRTLKVDVRVIATTNRQLEHSVERKEFREDLFFRLNVVPIHVPPLRERREDIVYLAENFMRRYARKNGVRVHGLSSACLDALRQHPWPGNIRELQNVIERAVILCGDDARIEPDHLGLTFRSAVVTVGLPPPAPTPVVPPVPDHAASAVTDAANAAFLTLGELEKQHIFAALAQCKNNRTQAARVLDINVRTLRNKLNEYSGKTGRGEGDDLSDAGEGDPFPDQAV